MQLHPGRKRVPQKKKKKRWDFAKFWFLLAGAMIPAFSDPENIENIAPDSKKQDFTKENDGIIAPASKKTRFCKFPLFFFFLETLFRQDDVAPTPPNSSASWRKRVFQKKKKNSGFCEKMLFC